MAFHLSLDGLGRHVGEKFELHEVVKLIDGVRKELVARKIRLLGLLRSDQAQICIKNLDTER